MTILSKDAVRVVTRTVRSSLGTPAKTTVATYFVPSTNIGPVAHLPQTVVPQDIATPQDTSRSIRLATTAEVEALKVALYPTNTSAERTALLAQARYTQPLGEPLSIYADSIYIALWYGDNGLGYYVFTGYTLDNAPSQEVTITPLVVTYG